MTTVRIIGRDASGRQVAECEGMRYYVTECCGASAKGAGDGVVCRACYQPVDDAYGGLPGPVEEPAIVGLVYIAGYRYGG